ncbi:hypothetical protein L2E81_25640 [Planktothrix agardhii 1033]|jgi:hypothetical protein|uniref:hypothetical protein n=1 Tax=Planktothrix agardhii TaxID=1160 RepID=UPI001F3AB110|nr:hypothetical protein [Planktothrix agardhii]MCF3609801.1 hypothetical protein [Planktothrix agardhii 1033]
MGIFSAIKSFFVGDDNTNSRLPDVNQNAITPETFTPNQDNLYTSSLLVREANNRGWIIDDELVQQSGEIAKNAKQNAKNVKKFGKNIKVLSKAELLTAREMKKAIKTTADNDAKKYGIVTETQSLLDAQNVAYTAIRANYREQLKATNQRIAESLNGSQSRRNQLKGR